MLMAGSERVQPLMFKTLCRAVLMNPAAAQREGLQVSGVLEASVNVCSRTFQTGLVGRGGGGTRAGGWRCVCEGVCRAGTSVSRRDCGEKELENRRRRILLPCSRAGGGCRSKPVVSVEIFLQAVRMDFHLSHPRLHS